MRRIALRRSALALSLFALAGAVLTETYYLHRMNQRLDALGAPHLVAHQWFGRAANLDPFDTWRRFDEPLAQAWDRMNRPWKASNAIYAQGPDVRLTQAAGAYRVSIDLPGIRPDDVTVRLDGRTLSIRGQHSGFKPTQMGQRGAQERYETRFSEFITLPGPVDGSHMQQTLKDGALILTLPRAGA